MNAKKVNSIITFVTTVMAGRHALSRLRQAREDGDQFELIDAFLNALVSGTVVIIRRLRRGEDEA